MRIAYVVSRFPAVSETFVLRELNAVAADPKVEAELLYLFPPGDATVHPAARAWVGRARRPGAAAALGGLAWWALRRPVRLAASVAALALGTWRRPAILARSLATVPVAAAHARALEAAGVEHVHAHFATYPALAAWLVMRLAGIPYSFTAHAHDLYVHRLFLARKVADATFVVTISDFNRRLLAGLGGAGDTPLHVVHCGIDPAEFPYRPRRPPPEGPVAALCVASLQEYKGHAVLLRALAGPGPPARLRLELVGGGPLRAELGRLAGELGVADRVRFRGSLPEPRVRELLERAELFVLPSLVAGDGQMEGLPVALMEALACGVPTVATRLSGIPELVHDGRTGVLAEPGDVESLREALRRALDADGSLDLAAGRSLVEREFDVRRSAARLVELFAAAIERPSRPSLGRRRRRRARR